MARVLQMPLRRAASLTAVSLVLILAGCGGSGSSGSSSTGSHSSTTPASEASSASIPQNNEGDHDTDNNGGPSDGDGNL